MSDATTQIYTHVLQSNSWAIESPADELWGGERRRSEVEEKD